MIERVSKDVDNKVVYFATGLIDDLQRDINSLDQYFICIMFFNDSDWNIEDMKGLIRRLIERGAVYFLFHGSRSEEVHDLADEIQEEIIGECKITESNVIGTSWFTRDSEEEILFSGFRCSIPADDYLEKFHAYVVISLGTGTAANHLRGLLIELSRSIEIGASRLRDTESCN